MKNEKIRGITLIALVITIIVLLILAGVSISILAGDNGILGKASKAKIENEKAEIQDMLALSVNTIAIERGQKQDDLKVYYTDRETFVEKGQFDTKSYPINEYNLDAENNIVSITIYKNNGTGNQYEYEINLETGSINFKTQEEVVDPNKKNTITYELNGGKFEDDTNIKEYKKGEIVEFISPVREGFAFEGWYLNSDFSGTSISQTTKDTDGDITLYAKWIAETPSDYFEYDGATIQRFSTKGIEAFKDGKIKDLVIPKKHGDIEITNIGNSAFSTSDANANISNNNIIIEKLMIQNNITGLGTSAFSGCSNIKELTVPISLNLVVNSNSAVFTNCTGITKVTLTKGTGEGVDYGSTVDINYQRLPWYYSKANEIQVKLEEGISKIGNNMFNGCTGLTGELIIPKGVTSLGTSAFSGCSNIKELTVPISLNLVVNSNSAVFTNCTGITKVTLTKGTGTSVDYGTEPSNYYQRTPWYYSKSNEIQVELEEGISKIGNNMFKGCTGLQIVRLPTTLKEIGDNAFNGCTGMKGEINTIEGLTALGVSAFDGCTGITGTIVIPSGIEQVSNYTFRNTKIEKLVIHDNVTSLGTSAFSGCSNIKELTVPISLNLVVNSNSAVFTNCTGITKVTLTKGTGVSVDYETGTTNYYQKTPWYYSKSNEIQVELEEGISKIGNNMFKGCTGLQIVRLPTTLKEIGDNAFNGCTGMKGEINTIEGLTALGVSAFDGCTGITGTIVIPSGIEQVSNYTFRNTKIEKLVIHDNVTSLGTSAFSGCSNIKELTVPISLNLVVNSNYAVFTNCTGITKVTLTKGTGMSVEYGTGTTNYYQRTPWYYSRNNKMTIILSKDIDSIGNYTFNGLTNATFYYTGSQEEWSNVTVGTNNTINIQSYNYTE